MSVRPNISSLELVDKDLVVKGEAEEPLPKIIQVVVVQGGTTEDGRGEVKADAGGVDKLVSGWTATLEKTKLKPGPVETMGIEVRIDPLDVRAWVQSLEIT
jgi:hypothetical protein